MRWLRLSFLEFKLAFGEFGRWTKYRRLCCERRATTTKDLLQIAVEVLNGGSVGIAECWAHSIYLKNHEKHQGP